MGAIGIGTVLGGKYRLEKLIGQGGMGSVWRAEHLGLHAPVAVKLLNVELDVRSEAVTRFHREAHAAASIRSPHVVQILDHGIDDSTHAPFIVMELMEGQSLADRLSDVARIGPAEVARIFTQVARALSRAHEAGIVHRDLKPDNVFLVRNEDEEVAKVLDFGIAKAHSLGTDSGTRTGAVMGTAYYMSPEQISGMKELDFRSDLWAFGVMACECLTGQRPFDAESIGGLTLKICIEPIPRPSSFQPVPVGFDAWFERITNRNPALRFASAREAAEVLRQVCQASPAVASGVAPGVQPLLVRSEGVARVHTMTTGAPLSRSANDLVPAIPPKPRTLVPLSFGIAVVALIGGGLWLQHTKASGSAASPVPAASVSAAAQPEAAARRLVTTSEGDPTSAASATASAASATASAASVSASALSAPSAAPSSTAALEPATVATHRLHRLGPAAPAPAAPVPPAKPVRDVIDDRR